MPKPTTIAGILLFCLIAILLLPLPLVNAQDATVSAQTNSGLSLRTGPGTQYTRILTIPAKTQLPVLARSADSQWIMVDYSGIRGWCAAWLTTITGDLNSVPVSSEVVEPGVVITTYYTTNMRQTPSGQSSLVSTIPPRTVLKALARNQASNWVLVDYQGKRGWVATWVVLVSGNIKSLPVDDGTGNPPAQPTSIPPTQSPSGTPGGYTGTFLYTNTSTVRLTYQRGKTLGRRPNAFSKVGDSESANLHWLQTFTSPHNLGAYAYLGTEITYFEQTGSFSRTSISAFVGATAMSILDPVFANPTLCKSSEHMLACEYRIHNPSVALILIRSFNPADFNEGGIYHQALRRVVKYSIDSGVIPVLSTAPHHTAPTWGDESLVNAIIRSVAKEYQIPLWDLWVTTEALPNFGVDAAGPNHNHLTIPPDQRSADMTGEYLQYGKNRRNLEALEILNILNINVIK